MPILFVVFQLIISEPTRALSSRPYEFIVVNGQATTSAFHKVV